MQKNKENFDFLLENNKKPVTFFLSGKKIFFFFASIIFLIGISVFITVEYFSEFIYKTKLTKLKNDNTELVGVIQNMETRLDSVNQELTELFEKDKALRTYADIPQIDKDIRKLGIGGKVIHKTTKLDKFIPNDSLMISDISRQLNQIERDIELEKLSYSEIYKTVRNHKSLLESTPSIRPIKGGYISSSFGYRPDPFTGKRRFHHGLDISANRGTPVYATAKGVVRNCFYNGGYGRVIQIDHGNGYTTIYAHLNKYQVKAGQQVDRGEVIGEVGNTGRSTGPHLHYEIRKYQQKKNPTKYFFTGALK